MSMESGKSLTSIGALLLVIGSFIPFLGIVGFIFMMFGLNALANYYKERGIFDKALWAVIFGVIGAVAAGFIMMAIMFSGSFLGFENGIGANWAALFGGMAVALVVAFIFYILMAIYFRKSFDLLATKTGNSMFRTAGLLLLIGAILTIVFIGLVLIFVAWILLTIAFFSLPNAPPPPGQVAPA